MVARHRFYWRVGAGQKKSRETPLRGSSNPGHDFSVLRPFDIMTSRTFGLVDMAQYIDYKTVKPVGG
jgi:hypothetical protein